MPGMTAYVNITVAHRQEALLAPNAALRFRPSDAAAQRTDRPGGENNKPRGERGKDRGDSTPMGTVYVIENGQPKPVRVATGITDNRMTEVLGGELKETDKIIVEDRQPPAKETNQQRGMRLF